VKRRRDNRPVDRASDAVAARGNRALDEQWIASTLTELPALRESRLWLTRSGMLHHCNDCGRELNVGDEMVWAQLLGVPFCMGCAYDRRLVGRTETTRKWRAAM
jgi:hypothetical protein